MARVRASSRKKVPLGIFERDEKRKKLWSCKVHKSCAEKEHSLHGSHKKRRQTLKSISTLKIEPTKVLVRPRTRRRETESCDPMQPNWTAVTQSKSTHLGFLTPLGPQLYLDFRLGALVILPSDLEVFWITAERKGWT